MTTILVIDDDKSYRTGLMELLNLENYLTLEAENGAVGLEMIHRRSPNLIICDVDMPVMTGIEVLRRTKSDPISAKIPFIIMTGRNDELRSKTVQDLGVSAYLEKGGAFEELLIMISQFLDQQVQLR